MSFKADGSDYIEWANNARINIGIGDMSLSFMVMIDDNASSEVIIGKNKVDGGEEGWIGWKFSILDSVQKDFGLYISDGNEEGYILCVGNPEYGEFGEEGAYDWLCNGKWHHILVIVDRDNNANCGMWLDGVKLNNQTNITISNGSIDTDTSMYAGRIDPTIGVQWMKGKVGNIRLWKRTIGVSQGKSERYLAVKGSSEENEGIAARIDEVSGSTAYDIMQQLNGTKTGGEWWQNPAVLYE